MRVKIQTGWISQSTELEIHYQPPASAYARPSFWALVSSLTFHAVAIYGALQVHFEPTLPKPEVVKRENRPTVLKVGDKLYFVAELPRPSERKRVEPKPKPAEKAPPKEKPVELAAVAVPKPPAQAPKVFAPPEVHKNLISESTLIQPISPPDLVPPNTPLPTFRVLTGQPTPPKLSRTFVAPGRRTPTPPDPTPPPPPPPEISIVHANPVAMARQSPVILPPTPVLDSTAVPKISPTLTPPPSPLGDPVNILSLSDRPVPPTDKLVIPPGNVIGRTGDGTVLTAGGAELVPLSPKTPTPAAAPAKPPGAPGPMPPIRAAAPSSDAASAPAAPKPATSGTGNPANAVATTAAALPTGAVKPVDPPGYIRRPQNGTFDAVVVQSMSSEQSPETRDLLTGRPIYTVYVSLGTPKDWALYFCIPGERDPSTQNGNVVKLGNATPVQAPYPTLLMRPDVSIPAFYKTVLVYGRVSAAGRFENLRVVKSIKPETDQALVASLMRWEFRPATRDGVNIGVEFLLSIPVAGL